VRYLLLVLLLFVTACGKQLENPLNWPVQEFTATDQAGKEVNLEQLKGKVWVADFIFTNCTTVCSPMTAQMAFLQKKLKDEGLDVSLVSFSVDPERDTPEAMIAYGENYNIDFSNWHFLTGYSNEEIIRFSKESFHSPVIFEPGTDQVGHVTSFFLVDEKGVIVKKYPGIEPTTLDQIIKDASVLVD